MLYQLDCGERHGSYLYPLMHVALSIPELQTPDKLAAYFSLPLQRVQNALSFLESLGLAVRKGYAREIGPRHIHLPDDGDLIIQHYTNWKLRAMESLAMTRIEDLHYSVVFTFSKSDALILKREMLRTIESVMSTVKKSPEEQVMVWSLDFFNPQAW